MFPSHWQVILLEAREADTGDVITRDGEFLGTWDLVEGVFWSFTPDGADNSLCFEPRLGAFCYLIEAWNDNGRVLPLG